MSTEIVHCKECRYAGQDDRNEHNRCCHRRAPTKDIHVTFHVLHFVAGSEVASKESEGSLIEHEDYGPWPVVWKDDWCGEGEKL